MGMRFHTANGNFAWDPSTQRGGKVPVITGLAELREHAKIVDQYERLGLLYNQASIDIDFGGSCEVVYGILGDRLTTLFGPQHGVGSMEQDNMIETGHFLHQPLGFASSSLYSSSRRPSPEMLDNVDAVLVDIQDVGARVYTFCATVALLMEECAALGKPVIILDRPNPINGENDR